MSWLLMLFIQSFDTVDRSILYCSLGRLGLPDWFRKVYFSFHSQVRLRFKLAAGLGEPWCRDGGIPQGCPLSMVFIVAMRVPWCRHLEALPDVKPQLYANNLKCSAERPGAFFESARFTARYVRSVGQDVSPGKCVLLSTSKSVRKAMKLWDMLLGMVASGRFSLDVRDLGGHLDFTRRACAGTLSKRVGEGHGWSLLPLVLYLWGFMLSWGWFVVCICLLASMLLRPPMSPPRPLVLFGLPLCVQFGLLKCLLPTQLAILNLLDGPVGIDPAFSCYLGQVSHDVHRYLAYCPSEDTRDFSDVGSYFSGFSGSWSGSSPSYLCCRTGFCLGWGGARLGIGFLFHPLRMITEPIQHFYSSILDAWRFSVFAELSERKGFRCVEFADFQGSLQLLDLVPPAGTR